MSEQARPMEKELAEIRKEVIEARNLVIKNDNLLKNLGVDLKNIGKRQEEFARRQFFASAAFYVLFAAVVTGGAVVAARGWVAQARGEAEELRDRSTKAAKSAEDVKAAEVAAEKASAAAFAAYQKLDSGSADEREKAALSLAAVDKTKLTPLEARALDDRGRAILERIAEAKLESGLAAYKRSDFKQASGDLQKALQLAPNHPTADDVAFNLGAAAAELKNWPLATEALTRFVDKAKTRTNKDYAILVLAEGLEKAGEKDRAATLLRAAIYDYPASEYIPAMRKRLSALTKREEGAAAPAEPAPAAATTPAPAR